MSRSNYEEDDRNYLTGFLDVLISKRKENVIDTNSVDINKININLEEIPIFNNIEMNVLYSVAGYIIHSLHKTSTLCQNCVRSVRRKKNDTFQYSKLVRIRCYKKDTLFYINEATFNIFLQMEHIYRQYEKQITFTSHVNIKTQLEKLFTTYIKCNFIPICHNLRLKIFKRFAVFRCKIACKKYKEQKRYFDSKTMTMHTI